MRIFARVRRVKADKTQQLARAVLDFGIVFRKLECSDGIGDDAPHAPARVKAGIRVLKDHLDAAAQRPQVTGF